jgi:glycosyltransferase 2 family protein
MKNKKKFLRLFLALAVSLGIFIFLFNRLSFKKLIDVASGTNLKILSLALLISALSNTLLISWRWKMILARLKQTITFKESLFIKMGTRILPLKTDEISRVIYLKKIKNIPYSIAAFSVISEYLVSIVVLLIFTAAGGAVYFAKNKNEILFSWLIFAGVTSFRQELKSKRMVKCWNIIKLYFSKSQVIFKDKKIVGITILYWGLDLLNVFLLAWALGNPLPIYALFLFVPLVTFIGNLPISIGGLGLRELALIFFFSPWGSFELLLALSLLYYFTEQLFPNFIAVVFNGFFFDKVAWSKKR